MAEKLKTIPSNLLMGVPHNCAHCAYMWYKSRDDGGWAYCFGNMTWFIGQRNPELPPVGERKCDKWLHIAYATQLRKNGTRG